MSSASLKIAANKPRNSKGFTVMELIISMGIFAVLSALFTVNLVRPQREASISTVVNVLVADIKSQQAKAMLGDKEGDLDSDNQGIFFESTKYTLFKGSGYPGTHHVTIDLEPGITFSTINLPSSQIVFQKKSGDVLGFFPPESIILTDSNTGQQKTISITNLYGRVSTN